ncbi:MAG: hypothetical protein GXO91_06635 [FCB group bacterium]|nr:hypothetical protein [FCB group bacterium]
MKHIFKNKSISLLLVFFITLQCSSSSNSTVELKSFPLDRLEGILAKIPMSIDPKFTTDGNGSLKITTRDSVDVPLFVVGDIDIEKAKLLYRAKIRTENEVGKVYLEMWCHFPDLGYFYSRNLTTSLTTTTNWTTMETPFYLKKGENPDEIRLNLVITGAGTVWIDELQLLKAPLK